MKIKVIITLLLLNITIKVSAWRINTDILYLEKGDNIWKIAHSLTSDEKNGKELWNTRVDTIIKKPSHSYTNMEFKLKSGLFLMNNNNNIYSAKIDTSLFILNNQTSRKTVDSRSDSQFDYKIIPEQNYSFLHFLLPILVSLFIFISGQFIGWLKGKYERKNELDSIKATIHNWLIMIEPSINAQILGCNNFVKHLGVSTNIHPETFQFSPLLVDKLQQIDLKQLTETMVVNLKGEEETKAKMIFIFVSQIEFLAKMEVHIRENYDKFHSYTIELMEDWNLTYKNFVVVMNETSKQINQIEPDNQFVKRKNLICNEFLQHKNTQPLKIIFEQLINPLETEILHFLETSQNNELGVKFGYIIDDLKIIQSKWNFHKEGHIILANDYKDKITTSYNKLKKVAIYLRASEFKSVMKIK